MDITIDADNVEVNSGYFGGKNLRVDLREVVASDILESLFEDFHDYDIVGLILEQISLNDFTDALEENDREELYRKLKGEIE
jgi:hypothetical protein